MFQNFKGDIVRECKYFNGGSAQITVVNTGGLLVNEESFYASASTSMGRQIVFDAPHNSLFTFDVIKAGDANTVLAPFVFTYARNLPFANVDIQTVQNCAVPLDVSFLLDTDNEDVHITRGTCVIPKLPLADGELQYVGVGFIGTSTGTFSGMVRVHAKETQVFQPMK